jgi:hypothetical protein
MAMACARWLLPRAGRAEEEHVLAPLDEARGGEFVDELAVHLLVEVEVEAVERLAGVAEAGLLHAAAEEPVLPAQQLVADERGDEVQVRLALGGRALDADLQHVGHAREAQLAQRTIDFDDVHDGSPSVMRQTRSRYWVSSRMSGSIWRSASGVAGWRSR